MNLEAARKSFPGLADKVFLDAAAVSLTPVEARRGIEEFLDLAVGGNASDASRLHLAMDNMREEALEEAVTLLNTQPSNIALIESTTHGLNIAANALPLARGDNVLIADTEYLQVAIPWAMKQQSIGIGIKRVCSHDEGVLTSGDFEAVNAVAKLVKDSTVCGLARALDKDIDRAAEALNPAKSSRIHTFLATSPIHMRNANSC